MGLKLSRLSGSRLGFFRMGVMVASLSGDGTEPVVREVLIMRVMRGMRAGTMVFISEAGMGSRWQLENFIVERSLVVSEGDRGEKEGKV